MRFVRTLAESLIWKGDRLALAVFARIATPQVRLTKDPNTFFSLGHVSRQPPLRLEDDMTWDTHIESGIHCGAKLIQKDEELHGKSPNAKAFVLLSDGLVWSGEVDRALKLAGGLNVPVFVVGVGTTRGRIHPGAGTSARRSAGDPSGPDSCQPRSCVVQSHRRRRRAPNFELDREKDADIANQVIDVTRRRAASRGPEHGVEASTGGSSPPRPFYFVSASCLFGERAEPRLHVAGAAGRAVRHPDHDALAKC